MPGGRFAHRDGGSAGVIVGVDADPGNAGTTNDSPRSKPATTRDDTFHVNQNIRPAR
jgi:hypothetical protein